MSNIPFSSLPLDTTVVDRDNTYVIVDSEFGLAKAPVSSLGGNSGFSADTKSNLYSGRILGYTYTYFPFDFETTNNDGSAIVSATGSQGEYISAGTLPVNTTVELFNTSGNTFLGIAPETNSLFSFGISSVNMTVYTNNSVTVIVGNSPNSVSTLYRLPVGSSEVFATSDPTFSGATSEILGVCLNFSTGRVILRNLSVSPIELTVKMDVLKAFSRP